MGDLLLLLLFGWEEGGASARTSKDGGAAWLSGTNPRGASLGARTELAAVCSHAAAQGDFTCSQPKVKQQASFTSSKNPSN